MTKNVIKIGAAMGGVKTKLVRAMAKNSNACYFISNNILYFSDGKVAICWDFDEEGKLFCYRDFLEENGAKVADTKKREVILDAVNVDIFPFFGRLSRLSLKNGENEFSCIISEKKEFSPVLVNKKFIDCVIGRVFIRVNRPKEGSFLARNGYNTIQIFTDKRTRVFIMPCHKDGLTARFSAICEEFW